MACLAIGGVRRCGGVVLLAGFEMNKAVGKMLSNGLIVDYTERMFETWYWSALTAVFIRLR